MDPLKAALLSSVPLPLPEPTPSIGEIELGAIRDKLRARLFPEGTLLDLESDILGAVTAFRARGSGTPEDLAKQITIKLANKWRFSERRKAWELERVIQRRPQQLSALVHESLYELAVQLAQDWHKKTGGKVPRAKLTTEKDKKDAARKAKRTYDLSRRYRPKVGLIEQQFGTPQVWALDPSRVPPMTGPCMDEVLKLGWVRMTGDPFCLQSLFGMDRHKLPKSLPKERRGREIFYGLEAVIKCMRSLLDQNDWLREPDTRRRVLTGIISRARDIEQPGVATILEFVLSPYLVNSGN